MRAPEPGVEVALAHGGAMHRFDELLVGGLLEHVAERAGAQRLARKRGLLLHRQHDDLGAGRLRTDRGNRLEAGAAGHVEIEYQHPRVVAAHVAPRAPHVGRLGEHLEVGLAVEQQPQPAAHHGVVVGEDDSDCLSLGVRAARRRVLPLAHLRES